MESLAAVIDGGSDEQVEMLIEQNTRGWRLFPKEPKGAWWNFFTPFWGYSWDGTKEELRDIIVTSTKVDGRNKQHLLLFRYNGAAKFIWCSWESALYDFNTGVKHQLERKEICKQIVNLINQLS